MEICGKEFPVFKVPRLHSNYVVGSSTVKPSARSDKGHEHLTAQRPNPTLDLLQAIVSFHCLIVRFIVRDLKSWKLI